MIYIITYFIGMIPAVVLAGYFNNADREYADKEGLADDDVAFAILLTVLWPGLVFGLVVTLPIFLLVSLYGFGETLATRKKE